MIQFYVDMIRNGRLTIDKVPAMWRDDVRAMLEARDDDDGAAD